MYGVNVKNSFKKDPKLIFLVISFVNFSQIKLLYQDLEYIYHKTQEKSGCGQKRDHINLLCLCWLFGIFVTNIKKPESLLLWKGQLVGAGSLLINFYMLREFKCSALEVSPVGENYHFILIKTMCLVSSLYFNWAIW